MTRSKSLFAFVSILILPIVGITLPAKAAGDTPPVPYTPQGESWVSVPEGDKVYFEDFDDGATSLAYDDRGIVYLPAGRTCTDNARSISGPALVENGLGAGDCGGYDPYDADTGAGKLPLGFTINFFGVEYDGVYANTNGSITFDSAFSEYDNPAFYSVDSAKSSILFAYALDLEHRIYSNFWYAQTTIGGKSAAVFSWENYAPYSNNDTAIGPGTEENSFQIVIVDEGDKNFDAYFNYDMIETNAGESEGYSAYHFWIDLADDVTVGSNIFEVNYASSLPTACTEFRDQNALPSQAAISDTALYAATVTSNFYVKRESSTTVSFWSDAGCTTAINSQVLQDTSSSGNAYMHYVSDTTIGSYAAAIGWGTYVTSPYRMDVTEIFPNESIDNLMDGGSKELISQSINTDVVGRIVLGQRGGVTVGDPNNPDSPSITSSSSNTEPSAPISIQLPRFDSYSIGSNSESPELLIEGVRLWCVSSMTLDGIDIPFTSGFSTPRYEYINADISGITPGEKTLVVQSCMGRITYTDWITITVPVEPRALWAKLSSFGLSEATKAKIAAFNSSLGDGYTRIRCIVNSSNGDEMNEALAAQVCSFGRSNDAWDATAITETKDSFAGRGYWINIWVSGN